MRYLFRLCPACGMPLAGSTFILCPRCMGELRASYTGNHFSTRCPDCGFPLLEGMTSCPSCRSGGHTIHMESYTWYRGLAREFIRLYKFKGIRELSAVAAELFGTMLSSHEGEGLILVPVPCSPRSLTQRGWDQMLMIAKRLRGRGYRVEECVGRLDDSQVQKELPKGLRQGNAQRSYVLKDGWALPAGTREVVILDDVVTTGATIRAVSSLFGMRDDLQISGMSIVMD